MITNKYYIIPLALPNELKEFLVGGGTNVRTNNAGTLGVVKRKHDDNEIRPEFNAFLEYTHSEILIEMEKVQWADSI